jgi:hypothetical protein
VKNLAPCAAQEAAGCADLLKTQVQEEVEWEVGQQEDALLVACQ